MFKDQLTKIANQILKIDNDMRCFGAFDCEENTLLVKIKEEKINYTNPFEEEIFVKSLKIIKTTQSDLDQPLGKMVSTQIMREKIHQFIYFIDKLIIFITCEPIADPLKLNAIKNESEFIIKESGLMNYSKYYSDGLTTRTH